MSLQNSNPAVNLLVNNGNKNDLQKSQLNGQAVLLNNSTGMLRIQPSLNYEEAQMVIHNFIIDMDL